MEHNIKAFDTIVRSRRSVRVFSKEAPFDADAVRQSLERAILSPNSSNMQLWEFYRITSEAALKEMAAYCRNQMPATTARELVVFVARPDFYKRSIAFNLELVNDTSTFERESLRIKRRKYYKTLMPLFYRPDFLFIASAIKKLFVTLSGITNPEIREVTAIDRKVTIHKSIALAAQTFMLSIKAHGYDTCPMEGFDSKRIKKMLKLPCAAQINMVIAVGPAAENGIWYPQRRLGYDVVVKEI